MGHAYPYPPELATKIIMAWYKWQELSSCWNGRPFGHNRHGPKSGEGLLWGPLGPHWVTI